MVHEKERVAPDSPKTEPAEVGSSQEEQIEPHQLEMHQQVVQQLFHNTGSGESPEFPDDTPTKFSEKEVLVDTSKKRSTELIELELQGRTSDASDKKTRTPLAQQMSADPRITSVLVLIALILALLFGAATMLINKLDS